MLFFVVVFFSSLFRPLDSRFLFISAVLVLLYYIFVCIGRVCLLLSALFCCCSILSRRRFVARKISLLLFSVLEQGILWGSCILFMTIYVSICLLHPLVARSRSGCSNPLVSPVLGEKEGFY